ncbi:hypothetical protein M413DRAFT_438181, partial [Hebeloma cylindrosporum]
SLCGVPFVGAAAVVIGEIVKTCNDAKVHKQKSRKLANRCIQILNTLNDQAPKMEGTEMQEISDQLMPVLEIIQTRTRKWSGYNSVQTFLKNNDIKDGLDRCESDLDAAMSMFH